MEGLSYRCHLCFLCPRSDYFSTLLAWRIGASREGGQLGEEALRPFVLEEARGAAHDTVGPLLLASCALRDTRISLTRLTLCRGLEGGLSSTRKPI